MPRWHGPSVSSDAVDVPLVFVLKDGTEKEVIAKEGMNLLQVAHKNDIDLEGACGGVTACSTCHVIFDDAVFDTLEEACEEEEDMLDLAFALTPTSRLGCQIVVTPSLAGVRVRLPKATRNMYVDGHVPSPH